MKVLSASEAIWPALLRTYSYLFRTFKVESFLKLAAIATVSEGFVVSLRFLVPQALPFEVDWGAWQAFLLAPAFLPVTIIGAMALFLVGVYCVFVATRVRFGFFHCLIHQTRHLRAAMSLYTQEADRFFSACMLVWLTLMVLAVLAVLLTAIAAYGVYATPTPDGKFDLGHFFILFVPCFGIAIALVLATCMAQIVLNDLILPHMAIEGATFKRAWAAVRAQINSNRETFASYFVLRLGMPLLLGVLLGFAAWVLGLAVFGVLGMSAAGFVAMLDGTSDARAYLLVGAQVVFLLLGLGAGFVLTVSSAGPIGVFMRSYALFFYGGHYRALGNLLEPATPQSAAMARLQEVR